jgi:hypothetical protein
MWLIWGGMGRQLKSQKQPPSSSQRALDTSPVRTSAWLWNDSIDLSVLQKFDPGVDPGSWSMPGTWWWNRVNLDLAN